MVLVSELDFRFWKKIPGYSSTAAAWALVKASGSLYLPFIKLSAFLGIKG